MNSKEKMKMTTDLTNFIDESFVIESLNRNLETARDTSKKEDERYNALHKTQTALFAYFHDNKSKPFEDARFQYWRITFDPNASGEILRARKDFLDYIDSLDK